MYNSQLYERYYVTKIESKMIHKTESKMIHKTEFYTKSSVKEEIESFNIHHLLLHHHLQQNPLQLLHNLFQELPNPP